MPSQSIKDFKEMWARASHTMWIELFALRCTQTFVLSQFPLPNPPPLLAELAYAPECEGRLREDPPRRFLDNFEQYQAEVVTNRIVLLSAGFESYFTSFLDEYLSARPKYFAAGAYTAAGNKVLGEVRKTRGLVPRIETFALETGAKVNSLKAYLPYLADVYTLRNVIAHLAGKIDAYAASTLQTLSFTSGARISLSPAKLIELAAPVVKIAEGLDSKI